MNKKRIILGNPELTRNLWLQFSYSKLMIATTVIVALAALFMKQSADWIFVNLYLMIVAGVGAFVARSSVMNEFFNGTWDYQILSTQRPMSLLLGKLFGATSFFWYIGLILLVIIGYTSIKSELSLFNIVIFIYSLILIPIFMHSFAILNAITLWQKKGRRTFEKMYGDQFILLILFIFIIQFSFISFSSLQNPDYDYLKSNVNLNKFNYYFFGFTIHFEYIAAIIITFLVIWCLIALHQQFRKELSYTIYPSLIIAFILFWLIFFLGLEYQTSRTISSNYLQISLIFMSLTYYFFLFYGKKDMMTLMTVLSKIKQEFGVKKINILPVWIILLVFIFIYILTIQIIIPFNEDKMPFNRFGLFLFIIRDTLFIIFLNLSMKSKSPDGLAILYLFMVYIILPALLMDKYLSPAFFYPTSFWDIQEWYLAKQSASVMSSILPVLCEIFIFFMLCLNRWKKNRKFFEK